MPNQSVATRNPFLQSLVDAQGASVLFTEAERLAELIKQGSVLTKRVVLLGEGYAVSLNKPLLPRLGGNAWPPKPLKNESALLSILR